LAAWPAFPLAGRILDYTCAEPESRLGPILRRALCLSPIGVALVPILLGTFGPSSAESWARWRSYRSDGTIEVFASRYDQAVRNFCPYIHADALVAGPMPWRYQFWCGNAALKLPTDLAASGLLDQYLDSEQPGYMIASERYRSLTTSDKLCRCSPPTRRVETTFPPSPNSTG
jgi:hypothetical protein